MKPELHPVALHQLLHSLDQEYPEWAGQHSPQPREDAILVIASGLRLNHDVAKEVLEDLEAAGHTALIDPQFQRDRLGVWRS